MSLPIADDPVITGMVDDTGTGQDGDVVDKAMFVAIAEAIDEALVDSTTPSTQTPAETTAEVIEARGAMADLNARISGAIDENGILIGEAKVVDMVGTCAEDIADREVAFCEMRGNPGSWSRANATLDSSSTAAAIVGICIGGGLTGESATFRVLGQADGMTGLAAGREYFVSATPGALTDVRPTRTRSVGVARSSTVLYVVNNLMSYGAMGGRPSMLLMSDGTTTTTTGTGTVETTLTTYRILPGTLPRDGDTLRMTATMQVNNTAFVKTIRVKFGATAVALTIPAGAAYSMVLDVEIKRLGSASQKMTVLCSGAWQVGSCSVATPAEALGISFASVDLVITGQNTDAADVITHLMSSVRT